MRSSPSGADPLAPGPVGFTHRGLHGAGVPENSLAAFRAALRIGAGIECDLRLSADEEAMLFHDADLRRMCGSPDAVGSLTSAALASKRLAGGPERIPRLAELLALVGRRVPLLLELKTERGNAGRFCAAVARAIGGLPGPTAVMSFDPAVGVWLARHRPDIRRGLVLSGRDSAFGRWLKIMRARPQFLAVKLSQIGLPWVERERWTKPVYVWTVRTPDEAAWVALRA
ncbi:MAG: glycerophosphodiester phosphodiesterase, partial [Sphingomonadales bacterium]|nr:glycerophosphodiester phosphodiesterase [Sphingomonadales bacterium]